MKRYLKSFAFILVLLTSIACADNNMYWVCPDPNGYWTISGNWYNSPGDPNFEYPGGLATSGGSSYNYKAYARVQQGSVLIDDAHLPAGRIERIYLGGSQGAAATINTGSTINIYKFYAGYGVGTESTLNIQNGTVTVTGSGSGDPYSILANGGTSTLNISGGTLNITDTAYFCDATSGTAILNISGGTMDCKGTVYFGNTADNTITCNISSGTFICTDNAYQPNTGTSAVSDLTMNVAGGIWNPKGRVYLGNTSGSVANVNLSSGTIQAGGKQFVLGRASGGSAYYNQTGGTYTHAAQTDTVSGFLLGYAGSATGGYGEAKISGGTFDCSVPVKVDNGVFKVSGSNASAISVKSLNTTSGDGIAFNFINGTSETLAVELDAGGVTYIRAFNGGTNDPNGGKIKLNGGTLTVDTLAGFSGEPDDEYAIMYSPKSISATGLKLIVLSPLYDFEYFIEDDTENGGQWLKLRLLNASVWNGGTGLWNVSGNWTGGLPSLTQAAMISSGTVDLPTSGVCAAKKISLGGANPTLNVYTGSELNTAGELNIAMADSNTATVNISGGKININGNTTVASFPASEAVFNHTAGDVNIIGDLNFGNNTAAGSPAETVYNISGGNLYQKGYVFRLGYANTKGYFNQTGGNVIFDVNVESSCRLGYSDGWAEYIISGGSLTAPTNFVIGGGKFEVLGSGISSISFDRFRVGSGATMVVGLDGSGCTEVLTTNGHAVLEDDSNLIVRMLPGFTGAYGVFYDIVHAANSTIDEGDINISCEDANYTFEYSISSDGGSGEVLSVGIGWRNQKAYNPWPEDNGQRCWQDAQTLTWTNPLPSQTNGTILCDVYISDAAVDPNFINPTKIVNKQPVNSATATLAPDKQYMWRVDIYDQSYGTEHKITGTKWDFKTNPTAVKTFEWKFENSTSTPASYQQAISGNKITATANAMYSSEMPQNLVNGFGLEGLKHCAAPAGVGYGMWRAIPTWSWQSTGSPVICPGCVTEGAGWIKFDFDQVYSLGKMWVWNHNYMGTSEDALEWGVKEVTIEYSADGTTYNVLGNYTFNDATHAPDYEHNTEIDFGGINAKSVVITVSFYGESNYGGSYIGLGEVRFGLHNTTATETTTPDTVGTCTAKCNGSVDFINSSLYSSQKCADINDGFDYLYSTSGTADVQTDPNLTWTINCFVYADRMPDDGVLLAGFGDIFDSNSGSKRYIDAKPDGYIGFWGGSDATTITGDTKFDLRKWQMLTAACDGGRVRLYKNADWIGSVNIVGDFKAAAAKALVVPRNGRKASGGDVVHSFYGKIDDVTIYDGVLSVVEMQQLMAKFPQMQDIDINGSVNTKDLNYLADQWLTTAASWPGNTPGLSTWMEGFEDGTGYQARWTAYTGDWSGKSVVADSCAPQGSSVLLLTVPSNYIERSIGTVSGVFETSWYFRAPDANGSGNSIVTIADALGQSVARVYHTPENGKILISAGTGGKYYSYTPGNDYVKITLRVNQSIGRASLLINDNLLESGFVLHNPLAGAATAMRVRKYTSTQPSNYFDAITVSQSSLEVDYPISDIDGSGFVNMKDLALFAEEWMSDFGDD